MTSRAVGRALGLLVLVGLIALGDAGCASSEFRWWSPPPGGVIRDKTAAIAIARAMWASMNPELDIASEAEWQRTMIAHLDQGVWRITEPPLGSESLGGTGEFDLSAKDGRMLRVFFTQ
jgi:hypothetical protein